MPYFQRVVITIVFGLLAVGVAVGVAHGGGRREAELALPRRRGEMRRRRVEGDAVGGVGVRGERPRRL